MRIMPEPKYEPYTLWQAELEAAELQRRVKAGEASSTAEAEQKLAAEQSKEGLLLLERLRQRTPESIEQFNINEDGLAIHGSEIAHFESILRDGLGYRHASDGSKRLGSVDFNITGVFASDGERDLKIGFGPDRMRFGGQFVLVTDIFKKLWPNWINGMVKLLKFPNNNGVGGEIVVEVASVSGGKKSAENKGAVYYYDKDIEEKGWDHLEELPEPDTLLIPEFHKERVFTTYEGKKVCRPGITGNPEENRRAFRQLLSYRSFNAIVIPDDIPMWRSAARRTKEIDTPKKILEHIIEVQNRLLPKNEQIPVYNERGECLYNPLETGI